MKRFSFLSFENEKIQDLNQSYQDVLYILHLVLVKLIVYQKYGNFGEF